MIRYLSGFVFLVIHSVCFPQSGEWQKMQPPVSPPARAGHSMAEIGDGKALLFGGYDANGTALNDTWLYDCKLNTWTQVTGTSKPTARSCQAMARIAQGRVLLFGGWYGGTRYGDTWLFKLEKMQWYKVNTANNPLPRRNCGLAQIGENHVLMFGGEIESAVDTNDTWAFDLNELNWEKVPVVGDLAPECSSMNFAQIDSGLVLMCCGWSGCGVKDNTWLYCDNTKTWSEIARYDKPAPMYSSSMAKLGKDMAAFWGGCYEDMDYNRMLLFDLKDSTWVQPDGSVGPAGRFMHSLVNAGEGRLMMFGGFDGEWPFMNNETWLFTLDENEVGEENIRQSQYNVIQSSDGISISAEGLCRCRVYDIFGNEALDVKAPIDGGNIMVNTGNLCDGIYLLLLQIGEQSHALKVMVRR